MKTIKIIDLLNMISKGEEVPKYVKYYDKLHQKEDTMMCHYNNIIYKLDNNIIDLLDEVEILEDEKKLPEKLNIEQNSIGNYYIENEYGTKCNLTKHSKIIADKINEILYYLESKGDE